MKRKDVRDYEAVFALYTICHCADGMIDEIAEYDLPESFREGYRAVRSSISEFGDSLEQYCKAKENTSISDCED